MKKSIFTLSILCASLHVYANEPMIIMHDDLTQALTVSKVPELKIDNKLESKVETLKIESKKDAVLTDESPKKKNIKVVQKYNVVKEKSHSKVDANISSLNVKPIDVAPKVLTSIPRKDWAVVDGKKIVIQNLSARPKPLNVPIKKVDVVSETVKDIKVVENSNEKLSFFNFSMNIFIYGAIAIILALLGGFFLWFKLNKNEEDINYF